MNTTNVIVGAVVVLVIVAVVQAYQLSSLNDKVGSSNTQVVGTSGQLDTTGWTANEKMNYEMHGTIPARAQASAGAQPAQPQMVGGC